MTWKERVTRRAEALTSRSSPVSSILADVPNSEMKRKFTLECKVQIQCWESWWEDTLEPKMSAVGELAFAPSHPPMQLLSHPPPSSYAVVQTQLVICPPVKTETAVPCRLQILILSKD